MVSCSDDCTLKVRPCMRNNSSHCWESTMFVHGAICMHMPILNFSELNSTPCKRGIVGLQGCVMSVTCHAGVGMQKQRWRSLVGASDHPFRLSQPHSLLC